MWIRTENDCIYECYLKNDVFYSLDGQEAFEKNEVISVGDKIEDLCELFVVRKKDEEFAEAFKSGGDFSFEAFSKLALIEIKKEERDKLNQYINNSLIKDIYGDIFLKSRGKNFDYAICKFNFKKNVFEKFQIEELNRAMKEDYDLNGEVN